MSIVNDRTEIAAALDTVDGVRGYKYRPMVPREGDAWPTLPTYDLEQGLVWRPTWTVTVVLPSDEQAASEWMDAKFEAIALALRGPGFPESAAPAVMETDAGDLLVLEITLRSE